MNELISMGWFNIIAIIFLSLIALTFTIKAYIYIIAGKLNVYKKIFIKQFEIKYKKELKIENINYLIDLLYKVYKRNIGKDKYKLMKEKSKCKDNIECAIRSGSTSIMFSFISVISTIIMVINEFIMDKLPQYRTISINSIILLMIFICLVFLILSSEKIIDNYEVRYIKGYNTICLDILNEIEREIFECNSEKAIILP